MYIEICYFQENWKIYVLQLEVFFNHLGDGCRSRTRLKLAISSKIHLITVLSRMRICGYETNYKLQVSSLGKMTKVSERPLNPKKIEMLHKMFRRKKRFSRTTLLYLKQPFSSTPYAGIYKKTLKVNNIYICSPQ